ncbi:NAD(P)H-binding protein [Actinomadura rayongensis]|uniref:NAD(P)H-binding protein n=1 Tax=Actinomadura rayongensis TaxID=1429076 RepID=A0A6I4WAZ1_9ACTN|nr:NAD(P)H-binding protein [Actinomadura rayongensis]MXQ63912.1 NAD(P)H-binding protein [Actinomadura rayongensis]
MDIVIAGGHGKIALRLARLLTARGDTVRSLIRNPDHAGDVAATGAEPVVADLEKIPADELAERVEGADAAVFAAGGGPGSGVARKDTVDRGAAVLLAEAAEGAGVPRLVQISAMGVDRAPAPDANDQWAAYVAAKHAAEVDLRSRDLDWVIVRPGRLTDDPGTGRVTLADPDVGRGDVTRDDVAAVVAALLPSPVRHRTLDLLNGETPIDEAVVALG